MKQYFSFQWHITDECDQRCKHCYIFSGDSCRKLDSMNWEQIQDTFYNCLDFCEVYDRLPYFYLTGGDPILHPDFWRLLDLFHEHDIPFTIMGNPFHLNDQVCRELKALGCQKYQLSLDGLRETHDWFRKPGSFDCTLEKIGCINRAGIRSVIMTTVSKQNRMEVPGIIDEVVKADANIFAFSRYVPSGGELDTSMTPQEYRDLLALCDKKFKEYEAEGCETYFNKKDHLWTLYEYETGAFIIPDYACDGMIYGGCNCGNCHLTILPTGDVYACRRVADSKVGNVLEDRLADVWITSMEAYRNYDEFSKCSRCRLKQFCRGCPAVAKGYTGDFYGDDPQCWASEENGLLIPKTEVKQMKAVVLDRITETKDIVLSEVPIPKVRPGWVLVKVRAFGLNHSEKLLRLNEIRADYIQKPVIPGIECVGEIADPSDSGIAVGQKVVALMGGMGRSFNGSYAEYALLPRRIVFPIESDLPWDSLGAVPETYFTAWGSLFECLHLTENDTLLIRGATCALGYAALQIAKALGCKVIATTHREDKLPLIDEADEAVIDDGKLTGRIKGVTKALDLVGPRNLRDTLTALENGGIVCQTGLLGGVYALNGFDPIKDIPNGVYLTGFFSNYPTQKLIDEIFAFLGENKLKPKYGKVFDFENIKDAINSQDNGSVDGKIVVKL